MFCAVNSTKHDQILPPVNSILQSESGSENHSKTFSTGVNGRSTRRAGAFAW